MATQLQIRRGTSTQVAAFTGAEGEIVVKTTNDSVHVNDGSTAGGFEMARADLNNVSDTSLNAALTGNTVSALTITTLTAGTVTAAGLTVDTDTLVVDATNNRVGIGASSPSDKLHVGTSSGGTQLKIQSESGFNNCVLHTNGTTDSWRTGMNLALTNGSYEFYDDVNNVDRMVIESSGNVLAGVTNAGATGLSLANSYNLSWSEGTNLSYANVFRQASSAATVIGSGYKYSSTLNKMASSHTAAWARTAIWAGYGAIKFYADAEATVAVGTDITPTEKMRVTSAGVIIGGQTAGDAAADNLTLVDSGNAGMTIQAGDTSYASLYFKDSASPNPGYIQYKQGDDFMRFATGGSERLRITSTGSARFNLSSTLSPDASNVYYPLFIGSSSQMARNNNADYYWMSNGYYATDASYRAINNGHMVGTYTTGNGDYVFRVSSASVNAGSVPSWEETMKIDADGIVQKYKHPAFNAYNPAATSTGDIIICGATRLNEGGHFSTTTGAFTAPVAGVYHFTFAILVSASGSLNYHRILFEINTSGTQTSYGDNLEIQAGSQYSSAVMSITIYLNQYDYIRIRNQGDATYGTSYGSFSGHLVG